MSELKECPFCGTTPKHNDGGNSTYGRLWWSVWCDECDVQMRDREEWEFVSHPSGRLIHPPKECFERWNKRTLPSPLKE